MPSIASLGDYLCHNPGGVNVPASRRGFRLPRRLQPTLHDHLPAMSLLSGSEMCWWAYRTDARHLGRKRECGGGGGGKGAVGLRRPVHTSVPSSSSSSSSSSFTLPLPFYPRSVRSERPEAGAAACGGSCWLPGTARSFDATSNPCKDVGSRNPSLTHARCPALLA